MKGFISKTVAGLCLTSGLSVLGGCVPIRDLYDPCWPERYNYAARKEVCQAFTPQVQNGRIIDQTIWTYYFEPAAATLTTEGREHIKSLLQRRPAPDTTFYLATAQEFRDLTYDPAAPEKFVEKRNELNTQRAQELQKYLLAQTAGRNLCFQIVVHDPAEVGHELRTIPVNNAVLSWYGSFTGSLLGGGTGGGTGGLGTTGAGAGGTPGGGGSTSTTTTTTSNR